MTTRWPPTIAAGKLDAVSGVDPAVAADIAEPGDSRLLRYPGSTLTAVLFNLRPGHPAFASSAARVGLLRAIDREALIDEAYGGSGIRADSLIPTASPLFSGKRVAARAVRPRRRGEGAPQGRLETRRRPVAAARRRRSRSRSSC